MAGEKKGKEAKEIYVEKPSKTKEFVSFNL